MAVGAAAMGAVMLLGGDRLPGWSFQGFAAAGTLLVTGMIHFSGADTSPYAFLYLWVALYALYFFTSHEGGAAHHLHRDRLRGSSGGRPGRRPRRERTC